MNKRRLLLRTCWYYRMSDLVTALGIAVGTAVFAGSLIVGDSVRESLARIAEERLGDVDHVLVSARFFGDPLAARLGRLDSFRAGFVGAEALIATTGNCTNTEGGAPVPKVNVFGRSSVKTGTCIVSRPLAEAANVDAGGTVVIRIWRGGGAALDVPVHRREEDIASLRLKVARVAGKREMEGSFSFFGSQRPVRNAWVNLRDVQEALDAACRANVLFVTARPPHKGKNGAKLLQDMLRQAVSLEDYGLRLDASGGKTLSLESDDIFIAEPVERAADRVPAKILKVLAYLANTISDARSGREIPYSMVAGIGPMPGGAIGPDEIVLNRWAADDLKAKPGDEITLSYFVRRTTGMVEERHAAFKLGRIIETSGLGADRALVPRFKGITDAERMDTWDPPADFEFHPERIRPIDEEYWSRFGPAPKALVDIAAARGLWATRFGGLTSIRFSGVSTGEVTSRLLAALSPAFMGLVFRPIRFEQLQSAAGTTDFAGLFVGFSFFLIISSALLVVLLLRLSVEQRSRQIGMMLAQGFTARTVRRLLTVEGLVILLAGSAFGIAASVGYARLMMAGLGTLWHDAVGTTRLALRVNLRPMAAGYAMGFVMGLIAVWRGVGRFEKMHIASLTAGARELAPRRPGRGAAAAAAAVLLFACAVALAAVSALTDKISTPAAFFGSGTCLLAALLSGFHAWMARARGARRTRTARPTVLGFGIRNAARNPGRSILTVSLLASAYLILFAVGSMKTEKFDDQLGRHGGAGGYRLIAEFDIPLPYDIRDEKGRRYLGIGKARDDAWKRAHIICLRTNSGEDVSCRNLYRPSTPRILAVPDEMIRDGAFSFVSAVERTANPWTLLHGKPDGCIPVIADGETAQWILHKKLGETITVTDEHGRTRRLRIVALLKKSMFQGEVLMGEENFLELFPSRQGCDALLVRASPGDADAIARMIRHDLADFGATVETTRERLASFSRIANSYISAFEALGALGILLGSLGLAVVLVRGVIERTNEFALMSALGFKRSAVISLVLAENGFLLACGIAAGVIAALVAVSPQLARNGGRMTVLPATAVALTLVVSLALFAVCTVLIVRRITPASLRRE